MTKSQAILLLQIQTGTSKLRDILNGWTPTAPKDGLRDDLGETIGEQVELLQDLRSIS